MITKLIKVSKDTYFIDGDQKRLRCQKFTDECKFLRLCIDEDKTVDVPYDKISVGYGDIISFIYDDIKYIVDDGYRNSLVRAGYFVYQNYDTNKMDDKKAGIELRSQIKDTLSLIIEQNTELVKVDDSLYKYYKDGYSLLFRLSYNNQIVAANQKRKTNDLAFYPFNTDMDKYGTIYYSVFSERKVTESNFSSASHFVDDTLGIISKQWRLKDDLNHIVPLYLHKKVIYIEGE